MKLYDFVGGPNPKRVRVYLAEKNLQVEVVPVDIIRGENRTPEFLKKNPLGTLPVLEFDDGSVLTESLAIMEYFEELHPTPAMIGTEPRARAQARRLERMIEFGVLGNAEIIFEHTHPFMATRGKQSPDAAENARGRLAVCLKVVDHAIGSERFVAGGQPTIADCTLVAALDFAELAGCPFDPEQFKNVARWQRAFKQRPSAAA